MRNIIATLMLSQGTPMLSHGDEIGRTQRGNNSAYCQDSELAWVDWGLLEQNSDNLNFTRAVTALRVTPGVPPATVLRQQPIHTGNEVRDIAWLTRNGIEMTPNDWHSGIKSVAVFLNGEAIPEPDERGGRIIDDSFLLCFNAHGYPVEFVTPDGQYAREWTIVIDTADPTLADDRVVTAGHNYTVAAHAVVVLQKIRLAGTRQPCRNRCCPPTDCSCAVEQAVGRELFSPSVMPNSWSTICTIWASVICICRRCSPPYQAPNTATTSPTRQPYRPPWAAPKWQRCPRRPRPRHGPDRRHRAQPPRRRPGPSQSWWWDVLTHGRASAYAGFFDIDWSADPEGRILLPVLGSDDDRTTLLVDGGALRCNTILPPRPGNRRRRGTRTGGARPATPPVDRLA